MTRSGDWQRSVGHRQSPPAQVVAASALALVQAGRPRRQLLARPGPGRLQSYELMAGARELRMTTYAAQHAATRPEWRAEAQYRVDCLRGRAEPRPWHWTGIM